MFIIVPLNHSFGQENSTLSKFLKDGIIWILLSDIFLSLNTVILFFLKRRGFFKKEW